MVPLHFSVALILLSTQIHERALAWGGPNHQSIETGLYHALNRGNLRATIFHKDAEFKEKLRQCQVLFSVIAWFMSPLWGFGIVLFPSSTGSRPVATSCRPVGTNYRHARDDRLGGEKIPGR